MEETSTNKQKMEDDLSLLRQSYWSYLTTKISKTNGFDTTEIDLVKGIFVSSYLSASLTYLPEGFVLRFQNFAFAWTHKKNVNSLADYADWFLSENVTLCSLASTVGKGWHTKEVQQKGN
jgi:hypothetical protein